MQPRVQHRVFRFVIAVAISTAVLALLASCGGDNSEPAASLAADPNPTQAPDPTAVTNATATPAPEAPEAEGEPTPQPAAEPAEVVAAVVADPVVYNDDFATSIAPIFADKCASCHNAGGPGAAHWQLEDAEDLAATHQWIVGVVDTGFMPPWPASDKSLVFHNDRSLSPDQVAAIVAWSREGATLDVDPTTPIVAPPPRQVLDADIEIAPTEPYQGSTSIADDYRCLVYDPQLTEPTWVAGFEFVPDQAQIVHHAVGYAVPANTADTAKRQSALDDRGGWECYGGPRLAGGDLFIGWAPGQGPTIYPDDVGFLMEPGDYFVIQIHYHYDVDAPVDASTLRIDWSDDDSLDRIDFVQLLGPAEIPCGPDETGPLCDRDAAIARAQELYGSDGVLADVINRRCGVSADDFALADDGTAASACEELVPEDGEIIAVFGHLHEIGKSIRLTLNAGQPDEQILLDIPRWSFDWQLNYEPVDPVIVRRGDRVLLECEWDRSLRAPDLEPAYVVWADGTNDEMCFATVTTRPVDASSERADDDSDADQPPVVPFESDIELPAELTECLADGGITTLPFPPRADIDPAVERLFECATPDEVGDLLATGLASTLDDLLSPDDIDCISSGLASPQGARDLFAFGLPDATSQERQPIADLVGDCLTLSGLITRFGFPIPDEAKDCVDEGGRELLEQAALELTMPDQLEILTLIGLCQPG